MNEIKKYGLCKFEYPKLEHRSIKIYLYNLKTKKSEKSILIHNGDLMVYIFDVEYLDRRDNKLCLHLKSGKLVNCHPNFCIFI